MGKETDASYRVGYAIILAVVRTGIWLGVMANPFFDGEFCKKSFSFHSYGVTGNDFQLSGFLIVLTRYRTFLT